MVSVVIPCYNHAQYLEETVESVLSSSFIDLEVIIVDDGSIDDSAEVGRRLANKYENVDFYQQQNTGPSAARNLGISKTKGKYILPLDADDLISKDYIQKAVEVFESNTEVKVVYAEAEKFGAVNKLWKLKPFSLYNLAKDNMIYVSALYRKDDWIRVGGYTENKILVREDWEFWIKLLKNGGKVIKLPFIGFYYRIQADSRRKSMSKERKAKEVTYLNQQHAEFFKSQLGGPLRQQRSLSRFINYFWKS